MRGAFVVQLGPDSKPADGRLEGWVQEVDSCTELRFRSGEELLKFMASRFALTIAAAGKLRDANQSEEPPCKKKSLRKERKSS